MKGGGTPSPPPSTGAGGALIVKEGPGREVKRKRRGRGGDHRSGGARGCQDGRRSKDTPDPSIVKGKRRAAGPRRWGGDAGVRILRAAGPARDGGPFGARLPFFRTGKRDCSNFFNIILDKKS